MNKPATIQNHLLNIGIVVKRQMRTISIIGTVLLLLCGCRTPTDRRPVTISFPLIRPDPVTEGRIFAFEVELTDASIVSVEDIPEDWGIAMWHEGGSRPRIGGTCWHGASQLSDSAKLPRIVVRSQLESQSVMTPTGLVYCTTDYDVSTSAIHRVKMNIKE